MDDGTLDVGMACVRHEDRLPIRFWRKEQAGQRYVLDILKRQHPYPAINWKAEIPWSRATRNPRTNNFNGIGQPIGESGDSRVYGWYINGLPRRTDGVSFQPRLISTPVFPEKRTPAPDIIGQTSILTEVILLITWTGRTDSLVRTASYGGLAFAIVLQQWVSNMT